MRDGWYVPYEDSWDFEHYFKDKKSLCGKFVLNVKDTYCPDDGKIRMSFGLGICQECAERHLVYYVRNDCLIIDYIMNTYTIKFKGEIKITNYTEREAIQWLRKHLPLGSVMHIESVEVS